MQKMNFVYTNQANKIYVAGIGSFAGNDVVLLRGGDDDLGLCDLLLGELAVTSKFGNLDAVWLQTFAKVTNLFSDESLEGGNIDDLEIVQSNLPSRGVSVLANLAKHCQHRNVSLSGTSGSAN